MNHGFALRRLVLVLLVFVIAGILIGAFALRSYAGRGLEQLSGGFSHPDVLAEVRIVRDDWGVPHIDAQNAHDAYFALGFATAQDRTFQLELLRRLGSGRLAEMLGDVALPADKVARTMLWRKTAERLWADTSAYDPEFVTVMEAFVDGINYAFATQPRPIEFTMLGIEVEPFTPEDCFAMLGYMAYGFAEGLMADSLYTVVENRTSPETARALFPGYAGQKPVTVIEGRIEEMLPPPTDAMQRQSSAIDAGILQLAELADAALNVFPGFEGSNSWVVAPSRSASGGAILANDPHIGFSNPAVWYEAHIRYPGFEGYGVHLPLIPFAMIAHNRDKAWALTMFENDDLDLFAETFNPDNPEEVKYRGEWVEVERWTESIPVKGGKPFDLEIVTTPHGPLVTEMLVGYEGPRIAAWWVFHQASPASIQAFYELGKAANLAETRTAVSKIEAPGLNVSYADKEGNIAWWGAGKIPLRPAHVNPKAILDGASGNDEPKGWLPFDQNPQLVNPPEGIIVTSNNMSTVEPVGPMGALPGYWQPLDRSGRIHDLFSKQEQWSLEDLKRMQTDTLLRSGKELAAIMLTHLPESESWSQSETSALKALREWDGDCGIESVGATVYHFTYDALHEKLAADELGEDAYPTFLKIGDSDNVMQYALRDETSPLWDDVTTEDAAETMSDRVQIAFKLAIANLRARCGDDPAGWQWGNVHTVEYSHVIGNLKPFDKLFNIGPYPAPGTWESVAKMSWRGDPYEVEHGASMRLLLDYANYGGTESMWMVLPTGNSGHFLSPHFRNQARMYLAGDYRNIRFSEEDIARTAEHTAVLGPPVAGAAPTD